MGVRAIFQLATPWTEDEIFDLGYEQTRDVMVFTHLNHPVQRLTRFDHDRWTITDAAFASTSYPPSNASFSVTAVIPNTTGYVNALYEYVLTTIDEATGQESLPTVSKNTHNDLTLKGNANAIAFTPAAGSERTNVYRKGGGAFGYIGTVSYPNGDFVDDNIAPDFSQSYPIHRDPISTTLNYPATVGFWQQRSCFGRTYTKPNGIFTSQAGNLFNMDVTRPVVSSDATVFAVSGRRVNAVLHLVPLKNLIVFTTDAVFSISGGANGAVFGATDIDITPEGYRAASRVRPVVVDDVIFFHTAKGGSIRTLGYQFEADGYKGNDLTVFAPHFFRNVVAVDMNWAEFPDSVMNVVMSDGRIRALTWQSEQDVWGWSLNSTKGAIESTCTVSENGEDVTYFVVRRTIDGVQKRYMEYSASTRWAEVADCCYLDSAKSYAGVPASSFTGMHHLEGETITVLADGAVYTQDITIVNGSFTLPHPASKVTAGLPYESWIRTLPLLPDVQGGSAKGTPATVAGANVRVIRSRGLEIGQGKDLPPGQTDPVSSDQEVAGDIFEAKTRDGEPMGSPTELFTGELWVDINAGDWRDATVVVRQRYPLPMHITGITPEVEVGG